MWFLCNYKVEFASLLPHDMDTYTITLSLRVFFAVQQTVAASGEAEATAWDQEYYPVARATA